MIWKGRPGEGRTELLPRISSAKLKHAPGSAWLYSDAGFIALGELAARLGGGALGPLAERKLFVPLGMCATGFSPPARLAPRLVSSWPAHKEVKRLRKGQAYDPLAARMGGVSGHAGLFSTADDLARFGQMMLKEGTRGDAKVLEPASVRSMIRPHPLPGAKGQRGLGWDINSPHASGKGQLSPGAYGHTGYTGTSLWVDPERRLVVALLTNRSRFRPMPSANGLRRRVHNTVVEALLEPPDTPVKTGLDRLVEEEFKQLRGRKIGLITNRSAVDGRGRWIGDLLTRAEGVRVEALFVPEHGLGADVDRHVKDGAVKLGDRTVKVYSLFGPHRRPRPEALAGLDTLVFDVPVVGVRYYTYLATMGWAMEEAARFKLRFMVLDRPDPLGGVKVQGPLSSARRRTSANYHPLPVRYGMTTGELARLYNRERRIKARLEIIKVQGWKRGQDFRRQGLPWRNPSPNIRTHRQALLYGAVGLLEGTNLAVGRGTDSPFQLVGAPWIDHRSLLGYLRRLNPPGVHFSLASFTPASSRHRGKACQGVRLTVTDSSKLDPVRVGVTLAVALRRLYRARWKTAKLYRIISHPPTTRAILSGQMVKRVTRLWAKGLSRFLKIRERYLLY